MAGLAAAAALTAATVVTAWAAPVKPYVKPVDINEYDVKVLLNVGDSVPETSNTSTQYQMVGIPDGLGAYANADGTVSVYMNHENNASVKSGPVIGGKLHWGAFVSKWTLDKWGTVLSGERAYDNVYVENTLVGPAADDSNSTRPFSRFCSGYMAGPHNGFDRYIYFAGEETGGADTFSGKGGEAVAFFNNEAHILPKMGRFEKENIIVAPGTGFLTVVMVMEDGPATADSQLWMYVGNKIGAASASPLAKNGLIGGKLYVFVPLNPAMNSETVVKEGTVKGKWVEIPEPEKLSDVELEAAADAAGAFGFVRPEDGAFAKTSGKDFFFVTTGGNKDAGNELGRLYHLLLNPKDPRDVAAIKIVYNADTVVAEGGDIALSPDNLEVSKDFLMINEDGTAPSRIVMAAKRRDGGVWRFNLKTTGDGRANVDGKSGKMVAVLNPPGRDGKAVGPGIWETSGIIDTGSLFGEGTWMMVIQAHSPTAAPGQNTVEDGQLVIMRGPWNKAKNGDY
jgi:hypothetical protein